jgi:hypothetical protein
MVTMIRTLHFIQTTAIAVRKGNGKFTATLGVVIFDLDNALLQNKFLDACAKEFNFSQALAILRHIDLDQVTLARRTASFLLGKTRDQLLSVVSTIPMVEALRSDL